MLGDDRMKDLELTRRDLIRRGSLLVFTLGASPALLASCGGEAEGPAVGTEPGAGTTQAKIGGPIDFLSWEGYDLRGIPVMDAWRKKHGVKMRSSYIGTHDDIQTKIKSGARIDYDLITYYQGYYDLYRKLDILAPIDESKLPNLEGLFPLFLEGEASDRFWKVDGKRYGVPWTWGTTTCDYRADKTDPPESWFDLLKPKFKKKVGSAADANGAYTTAGFALGFDNPPVYTREQFNEASKFLRAMRAQMPSFAPSYGDLTNQLVSGEVIATFSGWAAMGVWAKEKGVNVQSTLPKEGAFSFCDLYAIPTTADNVDTTLAFINETLTTKLQVQQAKALSAGVVRADALPLLSDEIRGLYPYNDLDSHFKKAPFAAFAPIEPEGDLVTFEEILKEWEKITAGA